MRLVSIAKTMPGLVTGGSKPEATAEVCEVKPDANVNPLNPKGLKP